MASISLPSKYYFVFIILILTGWIFYASCLNNLKEVEEKLILIQITIFIDKSLTKHLENNINFKNRKQFELFSQLYLNQIQANFLKLNENIYLNLSNTILFDEPDGFNDVTNGNLDILLSDFCLHQAKQERQHKKNSKNFQLGLLLTSNDLYSLEELELYSIEQSRSTMGISPIAGIEWRDLSCLIVEFGVGFDNNQSFQDSSNQRIYPTRSFSGSAYVATHELAHNLGLHHDGFPFNEECQSNKWIMSPNIYLNDIHLSWSNCSLNTFLGLEDNLIESNLSYLELKKLKSVHKEQQQVFDAEMQCKFFSKNLQMHPIESFKETICNETLWCQEVSNNGRIVAIGPALEGTSCDIIKDSKICIQNVCTLIKTNKIE